MSTPRSLSLAAALLAATAVPAQIPLGDLDPGSAGSSPQEFVPIAGGVVFTAVTNAHGWELWASDGTAAGTRVIDLAPGRASGIPQLVAPVRLGDRALFHGTDGRLTGLFSTDGTVAGTRFVGSITMASGAIAGSIQSPLIVLGDRVVFAAVAGGEGGLFVSDGTAAGTQRLVDLPGAAGGETAVLDGVAWFTFPSRSGSGEVWRTDGTVPGTRQVAQSGPGGGTLRDPAPLRGGRTMLIERFSASSGSGPDRVVIHDETTGRITPVTGMPAAWPWKIGALPDAAGGAGRCVAYLADSNSGDGVVVGIDPVTGAAGTPVPLGAPVGHFVVADGFAWLTSGLPNEGLWRTDGTAVGTIAIWRPGASPGHLISRPYPIGGGRILVRADVTPHGSEPWTTDGVRTRLAVDVAPGRTSSVPRAFAAAPELGRGGLVFFSAFDVQRGSEPWVMDLSQAGAGAFAPVRAACASDAPRLAATPPMIGSNAFAIDLASRQPNASAALWFGIGLAPAVAPCGPATQPLVVAGLTTDAAGAASLPLPLPNVPALIGARLHVAGAVAANGGSFLGVADFSATYALVLGE